jgi:hypothetical protein
MGIIISDNKIPTVVKIKRIRGIATIGIIVVAIRTISILPDFCQIIICVG